MGRRQGRRKTTFPLMTRDVVFFSYFPLPFTVCFLRTKYTFFRFSHDAVGGRDRWFRNSLEFGAREHTGEDEIKAVKLDDLENDDITEEETKA